jgi:hypothetical protein
MSGPIGSSGGIPLWVFPLLAVLIWLGLRASRARDLRLPVILITPVIFIGWGLATLLARSGSFPGVIVAWLVAAVVGLALGLLTTRADTIRVDPTSGLVHRPGSWIPLARNLAIFAAKFALTFAAAVHPDLRDQLALWDLGISGFSAGYFLGWMVCLLAAYWRAMPNRQGA